jgi:hypothetical protein
MSSKASLLVAIANYGDIQLNELKILLENFIKFDYNISFLIDTTYSLEEEVKNFSLPIACRVYPSAVGMDLPFKHRQYFCEKLDEFDYFLFTENDILVTQESIDFIVEKSNLIDDDEIIGFCRYEEKEGVKYFTDYDVGSRLTLHHAWLQSGQVFFTPDSMHSGCYLLRKVCTTAVVTRSEAQTLT